MKVADCALSVRPHPLPLPLPPPRGNFNPQWSDLQPCRGILGNPSLTFDYVLEWEESPAPLPRVPPFMITNGSFRLVPSREIYRQVRGGGGGGRRGNPSAELVALGVFDEALRTFPLPVGVRAARFHDFVAVWPSRQSSRRLVQGDGVNDKLALERLWFLGVKCLSFQAARPDQQNPQKIKTGNILICTLLVHISTFPF